MNTTFTSLPGHKKLIVPQGILDPNSSNVVQIPRQLANSQTPMMVAQTRRGLVARALPEFGDELSSAGDEGNVQHLMATPIRCPSAQRESPAGSPETPVANPIARDQSAMSENVWQTPQGGDVTGGSIYETARKSGGGPQLLHYSSRVSRKVDNQPTVGKSVSIDVPAGALESCPAPCAGEGSSYKTPVNTGRYPPGGPKAMQRGPFKRPAQGAGQARQDLRSRFDNSVGPMYSQSGAVASHTQLSPLQPSTSGGVNVCDMNACPAECNPQNATMNVTQPRAPLNVTQPRAPLNVTQPRAPLNVTQSPPGGGVPCSPNSPCSSDNSDGGPGIQRMEFVDNVIRRFEDTPPSVGAGRFPRHWNYEGGFQPPYMSSPTEQFTAGECPPCTAEQGYEQESTIYSNIWETPPSLGLPKGSAYYNTIISDPFGEFGDNSEESQSGQPCPAAGGTYDAPPAAPRGHDGTYARPAENVFFNYSRTAGSPAPRAAAPPAPRGDTTFARPAENVFFDYPRPATSPPPCNAPCSESFQNPSGDYQSSAQQSQLKPSTRGATGGVRPIGPSTSGGTTQFQAQLLSPVSPEACPAECNPQNATMNLTQPRAPLNVTQPRAPLNVTQRRAPLNVTQPRAPLNVTQPRAPLNVTQPRAPLNVTQPRAPLNVTQPRAPLNVTQSRPGAANATRSRSPPPCSPCTPSGSDDSDEGPGIQRMEFVDNVIRRFEESPPSVGAGRFPRHWNYEGGFQPPFMSSPTEQFTAGECPPCTTEQGYDQESTIYSNIWETPPSLGLPKGSAYYNTIISDPFGEFGDDSEGNQSQQQSGQSCPGAAGGPPIAPRGHDGTYARPAENVFFNYSRTAGSPAPRAAAAAAPRGDTTFARPAENVFFDYPRPAASPPAAAAPRADTTYGRPATSPPGSSNRSQPCPCLDATY